MLLGNLKKISRQRITIDPDGGLYTLEYKKGLGVDTKKLGAADVKRSTDITWCPVNNAWKVRWLDFGLNDSFLTYAQLYTATVNNMYDRKNPSNELTQYVDTLLKNISGDVFENEYGPWTAYPIHGDALFASYEDAVIAEIDTIEGLRLSAQTIR